MTQKTTLKAPILNKTRKRREDSPSTYYKKI
jgi:hypothetical protein